MHGNLTQRMVAMQLVLRVARVTGACTSAYMAG